MGLFTDFWAVGTWQRAPTMHDSIIQYDMKLGCLNLTSICYNPKANRNPIPTGQPPYQKNEYKNPPPQKNLLSILSPPNTFAVSIDANL